MTHGENVYDFISEIVQDMLARQLTRRKSTIEATRVIEILLKIEHLIPQVVIDGDEMVKYFSKKSH